MRKMRNMLENAGFEEPIYEKYETEITLQNSRLVVDTSFIGSIMMFILTIISLFMTSVSKVLPLYLTIALLFSVIHIVAKKVGAKSKVITLLCNYAFLLSAFLFAIGLDIIQKNPNATTVCVLLVALPLLIVDKSYRETIFFMIITVLFMLESVFIKQSPKASIDVLNAVSFFIVGNFLGYKHNQMMLRNIQGHSLLENQRDTDALTNLYNKTALETRAVAFLERKDVTASMMVIDMDNFKFVNDTYGHHAGDEILVKIGELLSSLFRSSDLISRFGGDEFIIFLPMIDNKAIVRVKAEQILAGVEQIRISADSEYRAHICIGIVTYPSGGSSYDELFKHADVAMYQVKKNGKNGYGFYDSEKIW